MGFLLGFVVGCLFSVIAIVALAVRLFRKAAQQRHEVHEEKQASLHEMSVRTFSALCQDLDTEERPPFVLEIYVMLTIFV